MRIAPFVLGLALVLPAAASAQGQGTPAPADQAASAEKKICKREEGVGSRLGKRLCLTRAQWADLYTEQAQNRNDILGKAERENAEASPFGSKPQ